MADKGAATGVVVPEQGYTVEGAAKHLGVTARWLRENLINTGEIPSAKCGFLEMVTGFAIIAWIERNMKQCENADNAATKTSGQRSK